MYSLSPWEEVVAQHILLASLGRSGSAAYTPCLPWGRWLHSNRWGYSPFLICIAYYPLCHLVTSPPRETSFPCLITDEQLYSIFTPCLTTGEEMVMQHLFLAIPRGRCFRSIYYLAPLGELSSLMTEGVPAFPLRRE